MREVIVGAGQVSKYLTEGETENFAVQQFKPDPRWVELMAMKEPTEFGGENKLDASATYTKLVRKNRTRDGNGVVMSDVPMEVNTNQPVLECGQGHVLIGGLGLGMIPLNLQEYDDVLSITIVEISEEVIELVAKKLPFNDKVKIICADIMDWEPEAGTEFDYVWLDIWDEINAENWEQMHLLAEKFGLYSGEVVSWREDECYLKSIGCERPMYRTQAEADNGLIAEAAIRFGLSQEQTENLRKGRNIV